MDFMTTARLLMDIQRDHPSMRYDFVNDACVIRIPIESTVPALFDSAAKMFEEVYE